MGDKGFGVARLLLQGSAHSPLVMIENVRRPAAGVAAGLVLRFGWGGVGWSALGEQSGGAFSPLLFLTFGACLGGLLPRFLPGLR